MLNRFHRIISQATQPGFVSFQNTSLILEIHESNIRYFSVPTLQVFNAHVKFMANMAEYVIFAVKTDKIYQFFVDLISHNSLLVFLERYNSIRT